MNSHKLSRTGLQKIVSGGQTGVDRAALDVALICGIPCGGWCPAGRKAEDGPIPLHYPLTETKSKKYSKRTAKNVRDSDATLILFRGELTGGTLLTKELADRYQKPCLVMELNGVENRDLVLDWLNENSVQTLNIAGPRQSSDEEIYQRTTEFLVNLLQS